MRSFKEYLLDNTKSDNTDNYYFDGVYSGPTDPTDEIIKTKTIGDINLTRIQYFEDYPRKRFISAINFFDKMLNPLKIYRTIKLNNGEKINTSKLGVYWSWRRATSLSFGFQQHGEPKPEEHDIYLLVGKIDKKYIDWPTTLNIYIADITDNGSNESEIRIKENFEDKIELVSTIKNPTPPKDW